VLDLAFVLGSVEVAERFSDQAIMTNPRLLESVDPNPRICTARSTVGAFEGSLVDHLALFLRRVII
jgi:hypothetical protein